MIRIKILGGGCSDCRQLHQRVVRLVAELEIGSQVELCWTNDQREITSYGVMMTPGLVINGLVCSVGDVPTREELVNWLEPHMHRQLV